MKKFLHVGCGPKKKDATTPGFNSDAWTELRFDIDQSVNPDIVGTMLHMADIADGTIDAVFSSHNIEHLYPHEVPIALAEFHRVLKGDGFVVITCPDLQSVCALIADNKLTDEAYEAPSGPIAPIDILYGFRPEMQRGNLYMAHHCGFTEKVLHATVEAAGFPSVATMRRGAAPFFDLWIVASKAILTVEAARDLAMAHFPID